MTYNVSQRVIKVIADVVQRKEGDIQLGASLKNDLNLDSLNQMTLFMLLEDEFERTMTPDEVTGINTVKDIIGFIDRKMLEPVAA